MITRHPADMPTSGAGRTCAAQTRPLGACGAVAYILKGYPRLSETFIVQEIRGLEERGATLRIYALTNPHEQLISEAVGAALAPVVYLDDAVANTLTARVCNQLWLLRTRPRRYLAVWGYVLLKRRHRITIRRLLAACQLTALVERDHVRWLHAHFAHGPTSVADFVHLLTGLPFSFSAHAKDVHLSSADLLARKIHRAEFVATCTHETQRALAALVEHAPEGARHARKVSLVYHGVDVRRFSPHDAVPMAAECVVPTRRNGAPDPPLILSVARLVEKKGLSDLITACGYLRDARTLFRCAIYGAGPLHASLQRQISALGLADYVRLCGPCSPDTLPAIYRTASIFALVPCRTSNGDRDGIPNVLLEAMASGLPVVTTNSAAIAELIAHERTGLLVAEHDAIGLAAALARCLDDNRLAATLGAQARQHVVAQFDAQRSLDALAARFATLLGEPQPFPKVAAVPSQASAHRLVEGGTRHVL